jgi:hypothetical protein
MILLLLGVWVLLGQPQSQRRSGLTLTGMLRQITTPASTRTSLPHRLDLDKLNRPKIKLGPAPGDDLQLPHLPDQPTPTISLVAYLEAEEVTAVNVIPDDPSLPVEVNNLPVYHEWTLRDGDVLKLGGYRFKYENLQQRRRQRPAWGQDSPAWPESY